MNILRILVIAVVMTMVTTLLRGVAYPLAVTGMAQVLLPARANGQLLHRDGRTIGSRIIGQRFTSPGYFHGRPSAAGSGYDARASGGTNLGPTSWTLIETVAERVASARRENPAAPVPVDLVTGSASGLDPDVSPAAALFQVPRVAAARDRSEAEVRRLVETMTEGRHVGLLGEPHVNVLLLNLA